MGNLIEMTKPFVSDVKDANAYWLVDILWIVHATAEQTGGHYSVIEQFMPEGSGPPPHVHSYEDESFFVLDGEMTVWLPEQTLVLKKGMMGHVPRNTVHSFEVTLKGLCHCFNYDTPEGF